ncbi:uncharacterized protein LOC100373087 [Saccoglossus kowalevskii]|uniref:Uncharacterized protein LOC100373087 n=1 Tax=Saccoglossus kowalevskii TaxID=10224 RepID=A0ABM0GZS1_SACKO|nr:PREDICTED: uncharacterized protein LOC100373087 [Saccoglossus kowalevskii]
MKLNEKNVAHFSSCDSPVDREGWLSKRGELNKSFQKRWFVLKGNLLFYFERRGDKEPIGVIILEGSTIELFDGETFTFHITFQGYGTRTYVLQADDNAEMTEWMRAISMANYDYMKSMVEELQKQMDQVTQYDSEANFGIADYGGDEVLGAVGGRSSFGRRTVTGGSAPNVAFNPLFDPLSKPSRATFYVDPGYEQSKVRCLPHPSAPRDVYDQSHTNNDVANRSRRSEFKDVPVIPPRPSRYGISSSVVLDPTKLQHLMQKGSSHSLPKVLSQPTGQSIFHDQEVYIRSFTEMHEEFGMYIVQKINEFRQKKDSADLAARMHRPAPPPPPIDSILGEPFQAAAGSIPPSVEPKTDLLLDFS